MIDFNNRISHISDQLNGYSSEIADAVWEIRAQGYTSEEAIKIVGLGIQNIKTDVEHERNGLLKEFIEVINKSIERND